MSDEAAAALEAKAKKQAEKEAKRQAEAEELEAKKKELQQRLRQLDSERHRIVRELASLGGVRPRQRIHSPVAIMILQVLHEAGPEGLAGPEVVAEVKAAVPDATREAVATQLCRMAKRGEVVTSGVPGKYNYTLVLEQ